MKRSPVSSARSRSNPISIPLTGRCQYGRVRYEIIGAPLKITACHCVECQKQSGGAFGMALWVKSGDLRIKGKPKSFTRTADSGNPMTGVFCPDCGERLYNIPSSNQDVYLLKPGTEDDTSGVRPERMVGMRRKQHWLDIPNDIELVE